MKNVAIPNDSATGSNLSHMEEIFMHYISSSIIQVPFPIEYVYNSLYTFTYTIPIYADSATTVAVELYENSSFLREICNNRYTIQTQKILYYSFTIKFQDDTGTRLLFKCFNEADPFLLATVTGLPLFIKFSSVNSSNLSISNYFVTLNIQGTNPSFTTNGLNTCSATVSCLEGYKCSGTACVKCNENCRYCATAPNVCSVCGRNTIRNGDCIFDYVDLSQYSDIVDSQVPPPRSNRVTLGVWTFVSDYEAMSRTGNVFHVSIEDFFTLSFSVSSNGMDVYCTIYDKIYPNVKKTKDFNTFNGELQKTTMSGLSIQSTVPNSEGRWFHSQCAMSLDHATYYLSTLTNSIPVPISKPIPRLKFHADKTLNDEYFRIIYRNGDTLTMSILNVQPMKTKVYMKNLVIFQEYIPPDIKYMYHKFPSFINTLNDFPEVIYMIAFDNFDGIQLTVKRIPSIGNPKLPLKNVGTVTQLPPLNFKTLRLLDKNEKYNKIDLNGIIPLTKSPDDAYVYENNSPFACENARWLSTDTAGSRTCGTGCDLGFITYPGISPNKGYCNYPCSTGMNCLSNTMSTIQNNPGLCVSDLLLYYKCVNRLTNRNIYFSSFFRNANVVLDFSQFNFDSYFIEFWFFPDYTIKDKNFPEAPATYNNRNYFFYSNAIQFYFNSINKNYYLEGATTVGPIQDRLSLYEWNKMVFNVVFDGVTYKLEAFINNLYTAPISLGAGINQRLTRVYFCHMDPNDCGLSIFWGSAFYKNIRVWDGDLSQPQATIQYDDYYPSYLSRLGAIAVYLPLSNDYFYGNRIFDPIDSTKSYFTDRSTAWNPWTLQLWNFSSEFDWIAKRGGKFYVSGYPLTETSCGVGCLRCWQTNICYACLYGYFLSGQTCILIDTYFFKSPCTPTPNVRAEVIIQAYPETTVTFWIKPIGFHGATTSEMVSLGNDLTLLYEKRITDPDRGLSLFKTSSVPNVRLANEPNFRNYFGKWVFISIAYYDDQHGAFFPPMLKFEIDSNSYQVQMLQLNSKMTFSFFYISSDFYGLVYSIKVYDKFIVGAYGFESNPTRPTEISRPQVMNHYLVGGNTNGNCYSRSDLNNRDQFDCQTDYDPRLYAKCNNYQYVNGNLGCSACPVEPTRNTCVSFCYNGNAKSCTCMTRNNNSQMFMKNNNAIYCKQFDYINWAKAKDVAITVQTAKTTQRFTMHFWVYAYSYKSFIFQGITFKWDYHNVIFIEQIGNQYVFRCEVFYSGGASVSRTLNIGINKWNFLSCAVDFTEGKMYMNTNNDHPDSLTDIINKTPHQNLLSDLFTTLTIQDNTSTKQPGYLEWGVLFYSQIRLWNEAYFTAEFLSRINIESHILFPYLLHAWEPKFNMNQIVSEIENNVLVMTIENQGSIGPNIVSEADYSTLFLCNENGQYYDVSTQKCLQFVDLSRVNDITFRSVPVSYTSNYSIAFWFFTEDYNTLTEGIHLQWTKHMQISIQKKVLLSAICFPQGYYADLISNSNLSDKESNVLNKKDETLQGTSGVWHWVLCSMSNFNKKFELNGQKENLIYETLFDTTQVSYPYRYYMMEENEMSELNLINIANTMKIYFRSIQLFNDFIPYAYDIKYMDLSLMKHKEFPSLVFVVNFANYNNADPTRPLLSYSTYDAVRRNDLSVLLSFLPGTGKMALSANFIFLPLCDFAQFNGNHYDPATNLCVANQSCDKNLKKAIYCSNNDIPLVCQINNYINIDATNNLSCGGGCIQGVTRSPGTPPVQAICNSVCSPNIDKCPYQGTGDLGNFPGSYKCNNSFLRINYQCRNENESPNSGFYYSRCYKPPNIYHQISNGAKLKMPLGYLLEFWFKIDFSLNTCARKYDDDYYFYSTPHSVYVNTKTNVWYYKVVNTVNMGPLSGIHGYEWNRVVIKTTLGAGGQSVQVFVNSRFNSPDVTIKTIPASTSMQLQYISFCSNDNNGKCTAGGNASINWGSAYYRFIRVWDLKSSSTEVVQAYNNKVFSNIIKSLVLFYPLTIKYTDVNVLQEIISNENIVYKSIFGGERFYSPDEYLLYNYETNFDWGVNNPGRVINSLKSDKTIDSGPCVAECVRCYSYSIYNCYECANTYILINQTCVRFTHYYLKTPANSSGTTTSPISLVTSGAGGDMTTSKAFTLAFYIKFEGVIKESTAGAPEILTLSANTYLAYDVATTYLLFYQNNRVAFEDQNFSKYFGKWIPIVISNYIANTYNSKYPNMITLSVNRVDIPFKSGYTIPQSGVSVTSLILGADIVALFADLRVYKNFIQGNYGTITSTVKDDKLILQMPWASTSADQCITSAEVTGTTAGISCVMDYNEYLFTDNLCKDDTKFLDPAITSTSPPCGQCNANCKTMCFNGGQEQCTCDMTEGYYWLRRNRATRTTYCEYGPYLDFSVLQPFKSTTAPSSKTPESTLELWMFIYSYNTNINNFEEINIEWSLHNKITLINVGNSLSVYCYPLYDAANVNRYKEKATLPFTFFQWNLVRCGTDLRFKKYFMNGTTYTLATIDMPTRGDKTTFSINSPSTAKVSFGFVFLREIKLWQQYNANNMNSGMINLKSFTKYPGLLSYYKTDYNGVYQIQDIITDEFPHTLSRKTSFEINNNAVTGFMGYNIIDPDNYGYYSLLTLCEEGFVFNSSTSTCIAPTLTHCEFAGDISDNCITCDLTQIYLHIDGTCLAKCPPHYFELDLINQCRPCDDTCYTCSGILPTECTSCISPLYFNPKENTCITPCESAGLTASLIRPNVCVDFEAGAELVNVSEDVPIDINTFTNLVARIYGATAPPTSYLWRFDAAETMALNSNDPSLVLNGSPFADPTKLGLLDTPINNLFFQLGFKYVVYLDIIKTETGHSVTVPVRFVLTMNASPKNGKLTIVPPVGLYNTTTFIMTCEEWTDDTTTNLQYQFYSMETNTNTRKTLSTWSSINEVFSNFTVVYYQQPSSTINVFCEIRDQYNAVTVISKLITIANSIKSAEYNLTIALSNYIFPPVVTEAILLARSEFLKSLGLDTYKTLQPNLLQTKFDPSLDQTLVTKKDPVCTTDYCNSNGECDLVDIFIGCNCELGFVGRNCHIDKNGYDGLQKAYTQLYEKLFAELKNSITYDQFKTLYNLYFSAALFHQDPTFFSNKLDTFLTLAMNLFQSSVLNNTIEYLDLFEFYYSYELTRLVKARLNNKNSTGYPYRNVTLTEAQQKEFGVSFNYIVNKLSTFLHFIANQYKNVQKSIQYESKNLFIGFTSVNPTFSDVDFFKSRASLYKSYVRFMKCLNFIEIEKLTNPYYQAWMIFIEFQNFPYAFNDTLLSNNTSPLILLRFVDATTGKDIIISGCTEDNALRLHLPFTSFTYLEALNTQKWLYDPKNYKAPNDPIFSNPIYINETGFISNDTIEMRIAKYNRVYNFSCAYYDVELKAFADTGIVYVNFTADSNYIVFDSSHLTEFTTFFIPNNMTFKVQSRFFYLLQPQLFGYWPNYTGNFAFFTLCAFIGLYLVLVFLLTLYDMKFFQQESLLEFLKREIVRVHLPYRNDKEVEIKKLVPTGFNPEMKMDNDDNGFKRARNRLFESENFLHNEDTKPQMLNINKFGDDKENNTNNIADDDKDNDFGSFKKAKNKVNFYKEGDNTETVDTKGKKMTNNMLNEGDMDTQNLTTRGGAADKKFLSEYVNNLPRVFEDSEQEYQSRLESFANLNLSFCQFMGQNLRERHIFLSPIINISLFNPRWKKMIMLVTQNAVLMILLVVQMTADENATLSNIGILIKVAFISVLAADVLMYILAVFFVISYKQRRRLFKLVTGGGQLVIIKEWEEMNRKNAVLTAIGVILNVMLWAVAFYFSISFVAVWSVQALSWMIAFAIAFFIDFILLEIIFEFFIALVYLKRKDVACLRTVGEFLNRMRNYRCLWP